MRLRWTPSAADDLYNIVRYIRLDKPAAARAVASAIQRSCNTLKRFPHRGRKGPEPNTRELVVPNLPYIVVYRILPQAVELIRIYHGAQDNLDAKS